MERVHPNTSTCTCITFRSYDCKRYHFSLYRLPARSLLGFTMADLEVVAVHRPAGTGQKSISVAQNLVSTAEYAVSRQETQ